MTNLQQQLRPLLAQFTNATGRGNLMIANQTLIMIVEALAEAIDRGAPPDTAADTPSVVEPIRRPRGRPRKHQA